MCKVGSCGFELWGVNGYINSTPSSLARFFFSGTTGLALAGEPVVDPQAGHSTGGKVDDTQPSGKLLALKQQLLLELSGFSPVLVISNNLHSLRSEHPEI